MAMLMAMKQVSVAKARDTLPALLHEAEEAPIEIVRRGKAVAVILSRDSYERLRVKTEGVWSALERFRRGHDLAELDVPGAFAHTRSKTTSGRRVRWR